MRLAAAGIDNPALDARLLLAFATGLDQSTLLRNRAQPVRVSGYDALIARRAAREPLAFIVGRQGFWTLDLEVSPATLIPRADSETLIEAAIAAYPDRGQVHRVLDLGTGTGCLLLAALSEFPVAWGLGLDRVPSAAALARRNAAALGFTSRVAFAVGDWAAPLDAAFDLVLSNPPYVPAGDIPSLMPEVAHFEPVQALNGGADGFDSYRSLLLALPGLVAVGGIAILELGAGQGAGVAALARAGGLHPTFRNDLSGVPRAIVLRGGVGSRR